MNRMSVTEPRLQLVPPVMPDRIPVAGANAQSFIRPPPMRAPVAPAVRPPATAVPVRYPVCNPTPMAAAQACPAPPASMPVFYSDPTVDSDDETVDTSSIMSDVRSLALFQGGTS